VSLSRLHVIYVKSGVDRAQSSQVLAVIIARGGSKRLPRKNLLPLRGKPLIAWTIEHARNSKYIDKILVSTDDKEIARISKTYGAVVPFIRPAALAADDSPSADAVLHTLDFLHERGYDPATVVLLQPTSPLRQASDIDNALELFVRNKCESVVSVFEFKHPLDFCYTMENNYLESILKKNKSEKAHKRVKVYAPNGAIYISSTEFVRNSRSFFSEKMLPYVMPIHRSIDIDTEIDFLLADRLMDEI